MKKQWKILLIAVIASSVIIGGSVGIYFGTRPSTPDLYAGIDKAVKTQIEKQLKEITSKDYSDIKRKKLTTLVKSNSGQTQNQQKMMDSFTSIPMYQKDLPGSENDGKSEGGTRMHASKPFDNDLNPDEVFYGNDLLPKDATVEDIMKKQEEAMNDELNHMIPSGKATEFFDKFKKVIKPMIVSSGSIENWLETQKIPQEQKDILKYLLDSPTEKGFKELMKKVKVKQFEYHLEVFKYTHLSDEEKQDLKKQTDDLTDKQLVVYAQALVRNYRAIQKKLLEGGEIMPQSEAVADRNWAPSFMTAYNETRVEMADWIMPSDFVENSFYKSKQGIIDRIVEFQELLISQALFHSPFHDPTDKDYWNGEHSKKVTEFKGQLPKPDGDGEKEFEKLLTSDSSGSTAISDETIRGAFNTKLAANVHITIQDGKKQIEMNNYATEKLKYLQNAAQSKYSELPPTEEDGKKVDQNTFKNARLLLLFQRDHTLPSPSNNWWGNDQPYKNWNPFYLQAKKTNEPISDIFEKTRDWYRTSHPSTSFDEWIDTAAKQGGFVRGAKIIEDELDRLFKEEYKMYYYFYTHTQLQSWERGKLLAAGKTVPLISTFQNDVLKKYQSIMDTASADYHKIVSNTNLEKDDLYNASIKTNKEILEEYFSKVTKDKFIRPWDYSLINTLKSSNNNNDDDISWYRIVWRLLRSMKLKELVSGNSGGA